MPRASASWFNAGTTPMKPNSIRPRLSRRRMLVAGSATAAAGMGALNLAGPVAAQAGGEVDLILVLAVDCSYSVDSREFRLQMDGIGHAFQHKDVQRAIQSGPLGRIAVTVFQWSDAENQSLSTPCLNALAGADIHAVTDEGKLVITLEGATQGAILDNVEAINALSGVLSSSLVYHQVEPLEEKSEETP